MSSICLLFNCGIIYINSDYSEVNIANNYSRYSLKCSCFVQSICKSRISIIKLIKHTVKTACGLSELTAFNPEPGLWHIHMPHSTCPTERPQPPRRLTVPQKGVESHKLRLHWSAGGDGSSPVRYFTLQTLELPDGQWKIHTSSIGHNNTSWEVER